MNHYDIFERTKKLDVNLLIVYLGKIFINRL